MVGRTIVLDGVAHEVIGIAQPGFDFPFAAEVYVPLAFQPSELQSRGDRIVLVIGRLDEAVTIAASQAELASIEFDIARRSPFVAATLAASAISKQTLA